MSTISLFAISSGGPRRHALLSQFEMDEAVWSRDVSRKAFGEDCEGRVLSVDVCLRWVDGVHGESLTKRSRLEEHAGDVLKELGLSDAQMDEFGRLGGKARPAERRVLGCLLANLRAIRCMLEEGGDAVVEDNVRILRDASVLKKALEAPYADFLYLGHLGHEDTVKTVAESSDGLFVDPPPPHDGTEKNHELWGTYAYKPTRRLYDAVLDRIRNGFPRSVFYRETKWDAKVTPADKLFQRAARDNQLVIKTLSPPVFFRMPPVLKSKIHAKWDEPFLRATTDQLHLYHLDWSNVWLTPEERRIVMLSEGKRDDRGGDDNERRGSRLSSPP